MKLNILMFLIVEIIRSNEILNLMFLIVMIISRNIEIISQLFVTLICFRSYAKLYSLCVIVSVLSSQTSPN